MSRVCVRFDIVESESDVSEEAMELNAFKEGKVRFVWKGMKPICVGIS